jgi:FkbM family methyltransferase
MIQGKGTGSGWDIASEISAAASLVKTTTPVLLDIGANFGVWSRQMLELFPGWSKLILVEPQLACLDSLARINFPNKAIYSCPVSEHEGEMNFFTDERTLGWEAASLFERGDTYFSEMKRSTTVVPVRTIDDIILENHLTKIDFMKLDIEGAELPALKGAETSLRRRMIKAISFEFGSGNINSRTFFRDIWDLLRTQGFCIDRILPGGRLLRIREYDETLEYFRGVTNYVATS